jgi:hypothetical protein
MHLRTLVLVLIIALAGCAAARQQQAIMTGNELHAADPEACGRAVAINAAAMLSSACQTRREADRSRCRTEASQAQPTAKDLETFKSLHFSYKDALEVAQMEAHNKCMVAAGYPEFAPYHPEPSPDAVERLRRNALEAARAEHYSMTNGRLCWSNHGPGGGLIVNCE